MKTYSSLWSTVFTIAIAILTPLVVILTIVRLMMTPVFPDVEYRMPGFPNDPYGFTQSERLKWSKISMNYLLSNDKISFFDQFSLVDGSPLYNDRELSHMEDVKHLVSKGRVFWLAILVVFTGLSLFAYLKHFEKDWFRGLRAGSYAVFGIIAMILLSTIINFDELFTQFHHLFFTGDSWIFYYSDTFIRLFPIRFWMDAFIYICVLSAVVAFILIRLSNSRLRKMQGL